MVRFSMGYDLELEGAVHFGKDLLRSFSNDLPPLKLDALEGPIPEERLAQLMASEPFKRIHRNRMDKETDKDGKPPKILKMGNTYEMIIESTKKPSNMKIDDKFRLNVKNELTSKGALRLKILAYYIKNRLESYADVTPILKNATEDYISSVQTYYEFINKKPIMYEIDKEFIVLDMIETTNTLLMNVAKKLLDATIKRISSSTSHIDMLHLVEKIKITVMEEKQDQLRYVCKSLNVCRPFPGFCDHTADLLSELLQLNDGNFMDIINQFNEALSKKNTFFKTITNDNVFDIVSTKLKTSIANTAYMREFVSILRSVITQRHKMFKSESSVIKVNTKAVRILLDVIDKAFEANGDILNSMEIQNTINSYKQWSTGERNDLDLITKKFVYNAVEVLNYGWGKGTKEEVKVLTDVLFAGTTKNKAVHDYLFKKGSNLIHDIEISHHSDMV